MKEEIEGYTIFSYRSIYDCVMDIQESYVLRSLGKLHNWQLPVCNSGRLPDLKKRIEEFANYFQYNAYDPENLTVPVNLYSDDTQSASGNAIVTPLWMFPTLLDIEARTNCKTNGNSLIALLPNEGGIRSDLYLKIIPNKALKVM